MIFSTQKKITIIGIIAIIITINNDFDNVNSSSFTKPAYEWTRIYMTKIILKLNIQNLKKMSHKKWNKLIKMINGNRYTNCKKPAKQRGT